jgi:hypothetical protein
MIRNLITDGIDDIVAMVLVDLDKAGEAAGAAGLSEAAPWLQNDDSRLRRCENGSARCCPSRYLSKERADSEAVHYEQ